MQIAIDPALDAPDVVALLEEHVGEMRSISPPESTHALDLAALRAPDITFFTVRDDTGALLACAALRDLGASAPDDGGHLELKSMRTTALSRGRGIGAALLVHLLEHARARGAARVSLETGAEDFFAPARSLYRRHGFVDCAPFGAYRPDPLSVFLTLPLGR